MRVILNREYSGLLSLLFGGPLGAFPRPFFGGITNVFCFLRFQFLSFKKMTPVGAKLYLSEIKRKKEEKNKRNQKFTEKKEN